MDIELVKTETEEDIDILCRVAEKAWMETYENLLPKGQPEYMIEKFQSPPAVKEQMASQGYIYRLILGDGVPGGFVGYAPGYEGRNEIFLSKLYLLPALKGIGAARKALNLVEAEAHRLGYPSIRLTVNKGNTHAYEVYRHWGFEAVESTVTDIGSGYVMDDYIMVKPVK